MYTVMAGTQDFSAEKTLAYDRPQNTGSLDNNNDNLIENQINNQNNSEESYNKINYNNTNDTVVNNSSSSENIKSIQNVKPTTSEIYIIADLSAMQLYLMQGYESIKTYPIVSKGKPGSYFETPAGEYSIKLKELNHFSSLGEVYMPYSMQFFGNFFIHGIPYHKNGERVSTAYSGGCIRMNDNDAKEIYEMSKMGTRIIIKNNTSADSISTDIGQETSQNMMTALISLEFLNQEKMVSFEGSKIKMKDLIYYIVNGNQEAINIIKNSIGSKRYVTLAESKSESIGLSNSTFENVNDRILFYTYIKNNKSYLLQFL